jgi:hypothetical protein
MTDAGHEPFTAYPGIEETLSRQLREAALDHEAFTMRLKACELPKCRATCCHDGALLTDEEMAGISEAVEGHRDRLARYGWTAERYLTVTGRQGRTVTLEADDEVLAENFPPHFPKTRCVFLDSEHRCVLQRLAMDTARHPWWWKPVSCWMHPLLLRPPAGSDRPLLTLARPGQAQPVDPADMVNRSLLWGALMRLAKNDQKTALAGLKKYGGVTDLEAISGVRLVAVLKQIEEIEITKKEAQDNA